MIERFAFHAFLPMAAMIGAGLLVVGLAIGVILAIKELCK